MRKLLQTHGARMERPDGARREEKASAAALNAFQPCDKEVGGLISENRAFPKEERRLYSQTLSGVISRAWERLIAVSRDALTCA